MERGHKVNYIALASLLVLVVGIIVSGVMRFNSAEKDIEHGREVQTALRDDLIIYEARLFRVADETDENTATGRVLETRFGAVERDIEHIRRAIDADRAADEAQRQEWLRAIDALSRKMDSRDHTSTWPRSSTE